MVTNWTNSDGPLKFLEYEPTIMSVNPQNKLQIPYYHPFNQWLLVKINGNQGQTEMDIWSSETINQL